MYIVNKLHNFPYLIHSFTFRDFPPSSASVNPIRLPKKLNLLLSKINYLPICTFLKKTGSIYVVFYVMLRFGYKKKQYGTLFSNYSSKMTFLTSKTQCLFHQNLICEDFLLLASVFISESLSKAINFRVRFEAVCIKFDLFISSLLLDWL